jgi:hypothetical protein
MKRLICLILALSVLPSMVQATCNPQIPETTPTSRFINLQNGTVLDTRTGLQWQRCPFGYSFDDNGTPADMTDDTCTVTGNTFTTWDFALSDQALYAGETDWRIPNVKELGSIVERSCTLPAINEVVFPNTPIGSTFWTASHETYNGVDFSNVWLVDFTTGRVIIGTKIFIGGRYYRRVRRGD